MVALEKLVTDHERLRIVLGLLRSQLVAGETTELQRMQAIVAQYTAYFNNVHRPLEDQVFSYIRHRDTERQHIAQQILQDHAELTHDNNAFELLMDEVIYDGIMLRADLVHIGWQFLKANLDNMAREEQGAFIWVRETLTKEDWAAIDSHPAVRDWPGVFRVDISPGLRARLPH